MSSLVEARTVDDTEQVKQIIATKNLVLNDDGFCHRQVLKPKNIYKRKCNRALKKKLKKYRLRKDGKEDQDVLDVSQTLLSTLKIKSPNNQLILTSYSEEYQCRPKNFLFKMARRKQKNKSEKSEDIFKQQEISEVSYSPLTESQEKKHTNAFQLMMDSRNKSIGTNSPGKDKCPVSTNSQEVIEKKIIKAKRNLVLQKMAEAKGSLRKKEMEESQDKFIQIKMDKRKERLKNMIKKNSKCDKMAKDKCDKVEMMRGEKCSKVAVDITMKKGKRSTQDLCNRHVSNNKARGSGQVKLFQLVDLFNDNDESVVVVDQKNCLLKEDEEFLNKLSPSIKKKENMLCYFNKIEKVLEVPTVSSVPVIKVKMQLKKKKKKSEKADSVGNILNEHNKNNRNTSENIEEISPSSESINERKKRKRKENDNHKSPNVIDDSGNLTNARPKRNTKKPVKYADDIQLSSSDEELHIFTPKKRKHHNNKSKGDIDDSTIQKAPKKDTEKDVEKQKKATKLAPIFATKLSAEEVAAKQRFLHSGIPDKLKKNIAHQKQEYSEIADIFSVVVHVQQNDTLSVDKLPIPMFEFLDNDFFSEDITLEDKYLFSRLITNKGSKLTGKDMAFGVKNNPETILKAIKELYPKFPVYRTYRLLKSKSQGELIESNCQDLENSKEIIDGWTDTINDNPNCLTWTEKYKAMSAKQLIGNFETIKELRKWLVTWTENDVRHYNNTVGSDSSDFCESDADSRDSLKTTNSLLVLVGPVGSGKTSSIYALASELAIKVIEVNASSKRTGKVMLQDLQEATQSHKVNRGNGSAENSQKSQDIFDKLTPKAGSKNKKSRKREIESNKFNSIQKNDLSQTPVSQDGRTVMSLILIDDADIVFDQDDGFSSAVAQLIHSSKRPVILITSSLECPHLQKFVQCGRIMRMRPFLPKILGTWLDIMCLADSNMCWPGLGARILDLYRGDIRKTINYLQFYMSTYPHTPLIKDGNKCRNDDFKPLEDECSSMSWADSEGMEDTKPNKVSIQLEKCFMDSHVNLLLLQYPLALFNIWWSLPNLLKETFNKPMKSITAECSTYKLEIKDLETISNVLDNFSRADCLSQVTPDKKPNISSQPWSVFESDSVSELENFDYYYRSHDVNNEILHELVTNTVICAQKALQIDEKANVCFPATSVTRERNRITTRHEDLSSYLSPSAALDRKALALDYWSTCRTICRIEKAKTDKTSKRNNRFCHYLKSLNGQLRSDYFEKLCDSLDSKIVRD